MQRNADLYNLTQQVQGTMYQAGQKHYLASLSDDERDSLPDRPPLMTVRSGYAESIAWMMVQLLEFDPEPLTVQKFRVRAVYSAPRLSQALLELIASEKWANRIDKAYHLTEAGRQVIDDLLAQRSEMFDDFEPIPREELNQLVRMSDRIIRASIDRGDEQGTWCLRYSNKRKPDDTVSPIAKLIHAGSDYNAFRDDAHMAAYQAQGVDGMTWEAFAFVDAGQATSADALFDQLAYRGWTVSEWQDALNRLTEKGWIISNNGGYQSTEQGQAIRQAVEQKTDTLFFTPWNTLRQDEQVEYVYLLNKLNDTCTSRISE